MVKKDELLKKAFETLEQDGKPTDQQKDTILDHILTECTDENVPFVDMIRNLIITYPWRFAFTAAAVQAVVFTIIFGSRYTNLFLSFFGG